MVTCPRCGWKIYAAGDGMTSSQANDLKKRYPNAFKVWQVSDDALVTEGWQKKQLLEICQELGRPPAAVQRRAELLNMSGKAGSAVGKTKTAAEAWDAQEKASLDSLKE